MADNAAPVEIGTILDKKYRVDRVLGVGGMGVVVAATHVHLEERVAIKFLLPHARSNAEVVARFAREARAAAKIKGEHVARVSDVGTLATGEPYMVMEYLEGNDLAQEVSKRGAIPSAQAVGYVLQACEALTEAHLLGIIHRDLKPANLFLTHRPDGSDIIKVLDFGISKMTTAGAADVGVTKTQTTMGSPLYMSPEQMSSSKKVDVRADIWSMGVVLYELLAGASPFMGESVTEVCAKIFQDTPAPLASSTIPPGLDAVVQRCLEKKPEGRYASMAELSAALYPFSSADGRVAAERIRRLFAGAPSVETGLEATSLEVASHAIAAAETIAAPRSSAEASTPAVIASTDANVANTIRHDASARVTLASPPTPGRSPVLALAAAITFAGLVGVGFLLKASGSETSTQVATVAPPSSATAAPSAAENPSATTSIGVSSIAPLKGVAVTPTASDSAGSKPAPEKPHATSTSRPPSAPSKPTATVDLRGDDRH